MHSEEKPFITISLDPKLQDFLYHEFQHNDDGAVFLNRNNSIALYIDSMWSASSLPDKTRHEHPIKIYLPVHENSHHIVKNHFLVVSPWKQIQISQYLEAEWRRRIYDLFQIGYLRSYRQSEIIEAILLMYGKRNNAVNYDQLKKMDYRSRRRFIDDMAKDLSVILKERYK